MPAIQRLLSTLPAPHKHAWRLSSFWSYAFLVLHEHLIIYAVVCYPYTSDHLTNPFISTRDSWPVEFEHAHAAMAMLILISFSVSPSLLFSLLLNDRGTWLTHLKPSSVVSQYAAQDEQFNMSYVFTIAIIMACNYTFFQQNVLSLSLCAYTVSVCTYRF